MDRHGREKKFASLAECEGAVNATAATCRAVIFKEARTIFKRDRNDFFRSLSRFTKRKLFQVS